MGLSVGHMGNNSLKELKALEQKHKIKIAPYRDIARKGHSRVFYWYKEKGCPPYNGSGWWKLHGVFRNEELGLDKNGKKIKNVPCN